MTITEKIEFLWDKAYQDALGRGDADPFATAAAAVSNLSATLRAVERRQAHPNGHLRVGCRASRRQAAERRAAN